MSEKNIISVDAYCLVRQQRIVAVVDLPSGDGQARVGNVGGCITCKERCIIMVMPDEANSHNRSDRRIEMMPSDLL